jgi:hypothetical protein
VLVLHLWQIISFLFEFFFWIAQSGGKVSKYALWDQYDSRTFLFLMVHGQLHGHSDILSYKLFNMKDVDLTV